MNDIHYLGIDPGITGALALVDCEGRFREVIDLPTVLKGTGKGAVKRHLNAKELQNIISWLLAEYGKIYAAIENVNAMPGQGVSSVFSLGDTLGVIRSVIACENIPMEFISPVSWKKYYKLSSDKEQCRSAAIKLYPTASSYLKYKKDHNKAEAILIARYISRINGNSK